MNVLEKIDKLTNDKKKKEYFLNDQYYKYSCLIADDALKEKMIDILSQHAMILIKPEALAWGRLEEIIRFLDSYNFKPVYYKFKIISEMECLELWKYQWPSASFERVYLSQKLLAQSESLIIILENGSNRKIHASTYLSSLKGAADENKRDENSLRSILHPQNRMLNYIHTSDEPADLIREIGVLFNWETIFDIYMSMSKIGSIEYSKIISEGIEYKINKKNELVNRREILEVIKEKIKLKCSEYDSLLINRIENAINDKRCINMHLIREVIEKLNYKWDWDLIFFLTSWIENDGLEKKMIEYKDY